MIFCIVCEKQPKGEAKNGLVLSSKESMGL